MYLKKNSSFLQTPDANVKCDYFTQRNFKVQQSGKNKNKIIFVNSRYEI